MISETSNAAPANLNTSATIILVCDGDGDVDGDATEAMSSRSPEGDLGASNCQNNEDCGECAEELGEIQCMLTSVEGPAGGSAQGLQFTINLLCPGQAQ